MSRWIVDPAAQQFTVLALRAGIHIAQGEYASGQSTSSLLLARSAVAVDEVFAGAHS